MDADTEAVQPAGRKWKAICWPPPKKWRSCASSATPDQLDAATVMQVVPIPRAYRVCADDACLSGNSERALKILSHLEAEGEECLGLTFMVCRELRALSAMLADLEQGHNLNGVLQNHRVWSSRTQMVTGALQRIPSAACWPCWNGPTRGSIREGTAGSQALGRTGQPGTGFVKSPTACRRDMRTAPWGHWPHGGNPISSPMRAYSANSSGCTKRSTGR
jgi:hypothetical protein